MRRRAFIALVGGATAMWPLAARAQQPGSIRRIGVLMGYAETDPVAQSLVATFRDALTKLGWSEGRNLRVELRWAAGDADKVKKFAKELVDLRPDVILGQDTPVTAVLARETQAIPIVFAVVTDPIGAGFVASLAHPGGNITGFSSTESALGGKWVELLKEIAPRTVRAAVLFNPATTSSFVQSYIVPIQAAASTFAIDVTAAPVSAKNQIESVIAQQAGNPGGALIVLPDQSNTTNRGSIIELSARYSVPTIYYNRLFTKSGGLISYGIDFAESYRQAAGYVDRILKGTKPADLPVQQPTRYELTINVKTAQMLGLHVPAHLQQIADEVIE
jgi:putative ABC transport system substrate-binding protein